MPSIIGKSRWAWVVQPDTKWSPAQWKITVVLDSKEALKAKSLGLRIKPTNELINPEEAALGPYKVTISRYIEKRGRFKGQPNNPPKVTDADGNDFGNKLIGNGSTVEVSFGVYQWENNFGKGTGVDLESVRILELVEYMTIDDGTGEISDFEPKKEEVEVPEDRPF